jgi:DNA-binding NarL/FixJ family response regulator
MSVADLLMSQHRWGRTRLRRFLQGIPMPETKTIGSMTRRQRIQLVAALEAQADSVRVNSPPMVERDELDRWYARLQELGLRQAEIEREQRDLMTERDTLVLKLSAAGMTRRDVADAAGITVGRVQQILASSASAVPHVERALA